MIKSCETCCQDFKPHHKTGRFCSIKCRDIWQKSKANSYICDFVCKICQKLFQKKIWPNRKQVNTPIVCSKSCGAKFGQFNHGRILVVTQTSKCKQCNTTFVFRRKKNIINDFCSKSCRSKCVANNRMKNGTMPVFGTFPKEKTHYSHLSGHFRGVFIRSSYEYAFIKEMETLGYEFLKDFVYEPRDLLISYQNDVQQQKLYVPDFAFKSLKIVFEIKPKKHLALDTIQQKHGQVQKSFSDLGHDFIVVTEKNLNKDFLKRKLIMQDPEFDCDRLFTLNEVA